jgi:hypothetical protein
MRSERGNTVEEPAVTMAPVTASGKYLASEAPLSGETTSGAWDTVAGEAGGVQAASRRPVTVNSSSEHRVGLCISEVLLGVNSKYRFDVFMS